ncbi:MAG: hypothetical protein GF388_00565 [Candidatus Aegiribacteria sp.]|nr:hypothetical protein [Candidatus Aegiribacteria sp.]MBD3293923.1 hypothetical protein [Candidatus Fermentibacteria bacterium]
MASLLIGSVLTILMSVSAEGFSENTELWKSIDDLNECLEKDGVIPSDQLEELFRSAVDLAFFSELPQQMEELRGYSLRSGYFQLADEYVHRAAPAISVTMMGESNSIGINVTCFLTKSQPGSESMDFFDIASDGFFVDGEYGLIGTAELPAWMNRSGSSAQAEVDDVLAEQYCEIWLEMLPMFDGYFRLLAYETLSGLHGGAEIDPEGMQAYLEVYSNPYAVHLRTALNSFAEGNLQGIYQGESLLNDLETYSTYASDCFIVLAIEPSPAGGRLLTIISRDRPDRIFTSWVYQTGSGDYQLRGFSENAEYTSEEINEIVLRYSGFLADTVFCL